MLRRGIGGSNPSEGFNKVPANGHSIVVRR
jgi:hypothetical protein